MSKNLKAKDIKRLPMFFSIDTSKLEFDEKGAPKEIQVLMCGEWNHPAYGPIIIKTTDLQEFKKNFDSGLRRDIPITEGHESFDEKPAVGWFKELIDKGEQGLWATTEWTPKGITLLAEKAYKYFSPEFYTEYEDPETREIYRNVLVGGALTNKPYFKKMSAVVLSEKSINNNYIFSDMDLKTITAKKVEELNAEEIAFLKENKADLSTEQLATYASVMEDAGDDKGEEGKDDKKEEEGKKEDEKGDDAGEDKGEDKGGDKAEMSEMVKISKAQLLALSDMANKGAKAFAELRETKIKNEAMELIFSEKNSKGKVAPKDEAKVFSFMLGLTDAQRKSFKEIVEAIPSSKIFGEVGSSDNVADGTAALELNKRVEKMMSENKSLSYADAVKKVVASDKNLAKQYEQENSR